MKRVTRIKANPKPYTDQLSESGARRHCQRLKAYWRERGYEIKAEAVERAFDPACRSRFWAVVSDLRNGLPRDYHKDMAA